MQGKSCFFIGHREAPEDIASTLASEVRRHITELGVTEFVVGHYGRFDSMATGGHRRQKEVSAYPPPAADPVPSSRGTGGSAGGLRWNLLPTQHGERAPPLCHRPS